MKKILLLFILILLAGCSSKNNDKLTNCCRYNGGFIENGKCVDYYSDYEFNNCMNENNESIYGSSTIEGQSRRVCCIDNGGIVSTNGKECIISKEDKKYLDYCLEKLK